MYCCIVFVYCGMVIIIIFFGNFDYDSNGLYLVHTSLSSFMSNSKRWKFAISGWTLLFIRIFFWKTKIEMMVIWKILSAATHNLIGSLWFDLLLINCVQFGMCNRFLPYWLKCLSLPRHSCFIWLEFGNGCGLNSMIAFKKSVLNILNISKLLFFKRKNYINLWNNVFNSI